VAQERNLRCWALGAAAVILLSFTVKCRIKMYETYHISRHYSGYVNYMYVCMCMYACMHVCMYVCVYMYVRPMHAPCTAA
jgi:hypothetical protein